MRLWLRLFDADGSTLATWEQQLSAGPGGFSIDSRTIRDRFGLAPFTGQLFIHAIGVAGHDVVKYALDTYASDNGASLSCTHDANAWPSDRFAGLPAPRPDETVVLWLQNSHAVPIPAGTIALDRMGAEQPVTLGRPVGPFATIALDVADFLPNLSWPEQIELRAGRHVVRPRYEVTRNDRVRIAHVNVERDNLRPDPLIPSLPGALGRGYILPFPILPKSRFRSIVQPTPMATTQQNLPIRLDVFDKSGTRRGETFLGCLPRDRSIALDLDQYDVEEGHAELVYDFRDGGEADGWLHALFRYEDRQSGHAAEFELWRPHLQYGDDLPGRAAILQRSAARPINPPVPQARRFPPAQLCRPHLPGIWLLACRVRNDLAVARRTRRDDRSSCDHDRMFGVGNNLAGCCVHNGGAERRRSGWVCAGSRLDLPAFRLSWADGCGWRVFP